MDNEIGRIQKDERGNILVDANGNVTCYTEGGLQFAISYKDLDFSCDTLNCTVDNKNILIPLHDDVRNNEENSTNFTENNVENVTERQVSEIINNEDEIGREENRNQTHSWSDASIKLFLSLYKEKSVQLANRKLKTKKIMWQKISEIMNLKGYNVTPIQAENKYKSLERSYKNTVTHNKQTGRNRMTCPFQTELTELLGHRHNIEPLVLSGNKGTTFRSDIRQTPLRFDEGNEDTENISPNITNLNRNIGSYKNNNSYDINEATINSAQTHPVINNELSTSNSAQTHPVINYESSTSQETVRSDTNHNNVTKGHRKQMGTTAKALHMYEQSIQDLRSEIEAENKKRHEIQKQILEEHSKLRLAYEQHMIKVQEEMTIANKLRAERNELLNELLSEKSKKL
ncbi:uncharacterized protein DDB_G0286591-like [Temnothorax curvispinosus]|uniref:Uncharacterized protein DDB_G0286591-like n=1 Tax=Temnothorax curvispinosus TaxID=300111 RepID=A0A6J1RAS2_9HYME|nr:uncharacterized protein DDB_G0286591-like [Temnothorax curvispinosus]